MALAVSTSSRKQLSPKIRAVIWIWAYIDLLSIISILPTPIVTALKPAAVYGPAYATINEDLFIIQGGGVYQNATFTANVSQFMALDLTRPSWDVSDPPWIPVNITSSEPLPLRLATYYHSMTVSLDRQTVTIWDSASPGSVTNYTRYTGAWSTFDVPAELVRSEKQLKAAVDPNTGNIYIPLGYEGVNMMVYSPAHPGVGAATLDTRSRAVRAAATAVPDATAPAGAGTTMGVTMPNTVKIGATGYSFVWSSYRQTFLYFGGRIGLGDLADPYFFEYQPILNAWKTLSTNGTVPPRLINSCMIAAYNGTKMILFGGHEMDGISKNTTYILDVPSMEWTKGPAVEASQSRSAMACSVAGDNVIIWGGIRKTGLDPANSTTLDSTPLIFNLYFNQWVQKFERGTHYTPLPVAPASPISPPMPEGTSAPDKEKSNVGDIVGGILGGVLVLALISASYIAHKEPQLLRQLICWGKEPDEQPRPPGVFSRPGLQPTANHLSENNNDNINNDIDNNNINNDIDNDNRGNNIDNNQDTPSAPPQDHPQDSEASTSPPAEHSAPVSTTTSPSDDPSSFEDDLELKDFDLKSPSRVSTLSSTTTLHAPDSPPTSTSTSRPRVPSNLLPSNPTRPSHRSNSLSFEAQSNRPINTWHSAAANYIFTLDKSAPSVPQVPPAFGVLLSHSSVQSNSSSVGPEVTPSGYGSERPKEPEHSKSSSSSSPSASPVPIKAENPVFTYMNDMRDASRQHHEGEILNKSAEGSNNHGTNKRPDAKNDSGAAVTKSAGRQVLPATTSTTETGTAELQYPPRGDETTTRTSTRHRQQQRDTSASEPFATSAAPHPREDPAVVAALRSDASLTAAPTETAPTTTTPRQPQGGHEPARTSSRSPQNGRGVGARKATFGDETPKLNVKRRSEDDERDG